MKHVIVLKHIEGPGRIAELFATRGLDLEAAPEIGDQPVPIVTPDRSADDDQQVPFGDDKPGRNGSIFPDGPRRWQPQIFRCKGLAMSSRDTMRFWRPLGAYGLFVLLNACHSVDSTAARPAVEERRAVVLKVTGDANGLCWDDRTQTLYLADDDGNRILSWTDKTGFVVVKQFPAVLPKAPGLGQLVVLANGTLVVTRFGHGSVGDIVFIPPSGEPSVIPGLEPKRRRIGLSASADGRLSMPGSKSWKTESALERLANCDPRLEEAGRRLGRRRSTLRLRSGVG